MYIYSYSRIVGYINYIHSISARVHIKCIIKYNNIIIKYNVIHLIYLYLGFINI